MGKGGVLGASKERIAWNTTRSSKEFKACKSQQLTIKKLLREPNLAANRRFFFDHRLQRMQYIKKKILGKRISLIDKRNTYIIPLLLKACSYVCRWVAQYQERIQFLDREYFCRPALRIPEGNLAALSHRLGGHYPEPPVAELSSRPDGTFWDTKENFRLKLE